MIAGSVVLFELHTKVVKHPPRVALAALGFVGVVVVAMFVLGLKLTNKTDIGTRQSSRYPMLLASTLSEPDLYRFVFLPGQERIRSDFAVVIVHTTEKEMHDALTIDYETTHCSPVWYWLVWLQVVARRVRDHRAYSLEGAWIIVCERVPVVLIVDSSLFILCARYNGIEDEEHRLLSIDPPGIN